jgi:alkanesulfonate monooxygenase
VQVARAAELAGLDGIVIPFDPGGEESWVLASALARETPRLDVVVEFPPNLGTAVYASKLALSFQRFFENRLSWQIVLGGEADPSLADPVSGVARDRRAEEFLDVTRGVFADAPYTFHGDFFDVEAGGLFDPTGTVPGLAGLTRARSPQPRVVLEGEREEELQLSARYAHVHLFAEANPGRLAEAIRGLDARAAAEGREVAAALRIAVVARDFDAEARRDLARAIGTEEDGRVWSGFGATGSRARHAIVGSYQAVAEQLQTYVALGIATFVLDGLHPVADAYGFGEFVRPLLDQALAPASLGGTR